MTDKEIVKGLECCLTNESECEDCSYWSREHCSLDMIQDTLNLINRQKAESNKYRIKARNQREQITQLMKKTEEQKAEIEEKDAMLNQQSETIGIYERALKNKAAENERLKEQLADERYLNTVAESDGIKEFAERLKRNFCAFADRHKMVDTIYIDNLVKEMTGEGKG